MTGMRSYNPEQIMLSAAVRRSSRDLNVMKEKLIFSGKRGTCAFITLGCFVACSCRWSFELLTSETNSSLCTLQPFYRWGIISECSRAQLACHTKSPACIWVSVLVPTRPPLPLFPVWRSTPVAACVMCTTSSPCYHQCDFFLYSMHPLHPSLPATSLPTCSPPPHPPIHSSPHASNLPS